MAKVELSQVNKIYPNGFQAVYDADFTVADREFVVLVGPSGCGKTTLLRMVAGLEEITAGDLSIDGRRVNDVAPRDRDIAMVFQNYALYPHMSVFENMAMGLRIRKMPKAEIQESVSKVAKLLGVDHLLDRRPSQLSGGQRQRVALGRAIVRRPQAFLFDEPLSNLDAKMRVETRTEISRLHHRLEATMIYVTHDQTEAMTMGDRIVVLDQGRVQQVATPLELYNQPANRFVAGFVGSPAMNFWSVQLMREDGLQLRREAGSSAIAGEIPESLARLSDRRLVMGLRPEDFHFGSDPSAFPLQATFRVEIEVVEPLGSETMIYWREEDQLRVARVQASQSVSVGDEVDLLADLSHVHFFDPESGETLLSWPGGVSPPR